MGFDFLSWAIGSALDRGATAFIKLLGGDLIGSKLNKAVKRWADALPPEAQVSAIALFSTVSGAATSPSLPRLSVVREALSEQRIPTPYAWEEALVELWRKRRVELRDDAAPLFKLPEDQARVHFVALVRELSAVLESDQATFQRESLAHLREVMNLIQPDAALEATDPDRAIDRACKHYTEEREPAVAIEALRRLGNHRSYQSPRLRRRIQANIGNAQLMAGDHLDAQRSFQAALAADPSDPRARSCGVVALFLEGRFEEAHEEASELLPLLDDDERLSSIWVQTVSKQVTVAEIERRIPEPMLERPGVAVQLAHHLAEQNLHDDAVARAESLHTKHGTPVTAAALGCRLLERERIGLAGGAKSPGDESRANIRRAIELLGVALESCRDRRTGLSEVDIRLNRSLGHVILHQWEDALFDARTAHEAKPADLDIAFRYGLALSLSGDAARAVGVLQRFKGNLSIMQATALGLWVQRLGREGGVENVLESMVAALSRLPDVCGEDRLEFLVVLVDAFESAGAHTQVLRILNQSRVRRAVPDAVRVALRLRAFARNSDVRRAGVEADRLVELLPGLDDSDCVRLCAEQLRLVDRWSDALSALKRLFNPSRLDPVAFACLATAEKASDAEFILQACEQLRANGLYDARCVDLEANYRLRFNEFDEAIDLIKKAVATLPNADALLIRLFNLQAAGRSPSEEAWLLRLAGAFDPSGDAEDGLALVNAIRVSCHRDKAPALAYAMIRAHQDDHRAHAAMILALNPMPAPAVQLNESKVVDGVSSVGFTVDGEDELHWVTFEDDGPRVSDGERGRDSLEWEALAGKRVGDTAILGEGALGPRKVTIQYVRHKFVRRYQDCLEHWGERFPNHPFVSKLDLPTKQEDGEIDLAKTAAMFKTMLMRSAPDERERQYRETFQPVNVLAGGGNSSAFEGMLHGASRETVTIRCCRGVKEEAEGAVEALQGASAIVIDSAALATLYLAEGDELLDALPFDIVTSSGTLEALRELRDSESGGAFLRLEGQQVVMTRSDDPRAVAARERFARFVDAVEVNVSIEGGSAVLELAEDVRAAASRALGVAGAECLALALRPGRCLWTDDLFAAELAVQLGGARRVWTQAVLNYSAARKGVSWDKVNDASVAQVAAGYSFLSINAAMILRACEKAAWDPARHPLKRMLDWLGHPGFLVQSLSLIVLGVMPQLRRAAPLSTEADRVASALIDRVASRDDWASLGRALFQQVDGAFGLDVVGAHKVKRMLESALQEGRRIIIP